jgi:hypothetical protein
MRINCKGINRTTKRLANGTEVTYYYAWKGGPRVLGHYGSPEFIASYLAACAQKRPSAPGGILRLLQNFQASAEFEGLAERTRFDYVKHIKLIERKFGDFPVEAPF